MNKKNNFKIKYSITCQINSKVNADYKVFEIVYLQTHSSGCDVSLSGVQISQSFGGVVIVTYKEIHIANLFVCCLYENQLFHVN